MGLQITQMNKNTPQSPQIHNQKLEGPWKNAMLHITNSHRRSNQNIQIFQTNPTQLKELPPFYSQLLKN
jgi:hypothetical protein